MIRAGGREGGSIHLFTAAHIGREGDPSLWRVKNAPGSSLSHSGVQKWRIEATSVVGLSIFLRSIDNGNLPPRAWMDYVGSSEARPYEATFRETSSFLADPTSNSNHLWFLISSRRRGGFRLFGFGFGEREALLEVATTSLLLPRYVPCCKLQLQLDFPSSCLEDLHQFK